MPETLNSRALRAVSDAVVTITAEHRFEPVLEKLAHAARQLAAARYAAIGVPDGEGAFYLTDKKGDRGAVFDEADQALIETLAAHAAVAIQNARLYERSRELTVIEERNRLARELHDAVNQTLFSVSLTADAAALLVETEPEKAKEQLGEVRELVRSAMAEMRSLIFELRPADVAAGFDPEGPQARRRLGLISMRERAEAIGGALEVRSAPGAGTTVHMEIDLDGHHPRSDR